MFLIFGDIRRILNATVLGRSRLVSREARFAVFVLIRRLLKESSLDSKLLNNYRPVSNSSIFSKILERIVSSLLDVFISECNNMAVFQSA